MLYCLLCLVCSVFFFVWAWFWTSICIIVIPVAKPRCSVLGQAMANMLKQKETRFVCTWLERSRKCFLWSWWYFGPKRKVVCWNRAENVWWELVLIWRYELTFVLFAVPTFSAFLKDVESPYEVSRTTKQPSHSFYCTVIYCWNAPLFYRFTTT